MNEFDTFCNNEIFSTYDYNMLKPLPGNRQTSTLDNRVRKWINQIKEDRGLYPFNCGVVGIVDGIPYLCDGNGRYMALKLISETTHVNYPFYFIVDKNVKTMDDAYAVLERLNRNGKVYSNRERTDIAIERYGDEERKKLKALAVNLSEESGIPYSTISDIFWGQGSCKQENFNRTTTDNFWEHSIVFIKNLKEMDSTFKSVFGNTNNYYKKARFIWVLRDKFIKPILSTNLRERNSYIKRIYDSLKNPNAIRNNLIGCTTTENFVNGIKGSILYQNRDKKFKEIINSVH